MVFSNFHVDEHHSYMFPLHCGPLPKKCSITFDLQLQFTMYQLRRSKNMRISYLMQHITLRPVQMMYVLCVGLWYWLSDMQSSSLFRNWSTWWIFLTQYHWVLLPCCPLVHFLRWILSSRHMNMFKTSSKNEEIMVCFQKV